MDLMTRPAAPAGTDRRGVAGAALGMARIGTLLAVSAPLGAYPPVFGARRLRRAEPATANGTA